MCAISKQRHVRGRFFAGLSQLLHDYPRARFLHLTLTLRNCPPPEIRNTVRHLNESFRRLVKYRSVSRSLLGSARSFEITRSKIGEAHPHLHVLLFVSSGYFGGKNYLSHQKWLSLWQRALRVDYTPVLSVSAIPEGDQEQLAKAAYELFKYSTKSSDLSQDALFFNDCIQQLHKTRSFGFGGVFKAYFSDRRQTGQKYPHCRLSERPGTPRAHLNPHSRQYHSQNRPSSITIDT